jgi:hypothetical protein
MMMVSVSVSVKQCADEMAGWERWLSLAHSISSRTLLEFTLNVCIDHAGCLALQGALGVATPPASGPRPGGHRVPLLLAPELRDAPVDSQVFEQENLSFGR